jgi:hypothetical protein
MRGKQIFDSQNNFLIIPKLFGADGYWKHLIESCITNRNERSKLKLSAVCILETEMLLANQPYGFFKRECAALYKL